MIAGFCCGVVLFWGVFSYFPYSGFYKWADRGQLFGALNLLFSGLVFAGVVIALYLQHRELPLLREELALTRKELQEIQTATAQVPPQPSQESG